MLFEEHPDVTRLNRFMEQTPALWISLFCMAGDVLIDKMETNMSGLKLNATFVRLPSHLCAWTWIFSRTMFTADLLTSVWNLLNWMCFSCDLTGRKSWNQINNGGWSLLSLAGDWFSCETVLCHHLAFNTPNISQPWFFLAPCCRSLAWLLLWGGCV